MCALDTHGVGYNTRDINSTSHLELEDGLTPLVVTGLNTSIGQADSVGTVGG